MKLLFFHDFKLRVVKGDNVVDVSQLVRDIPHTGPHNLISGLIERFADYRGALEKAAAVTTGAPLNSVRIRPPLPQPVNIDAMAVNYMADGTRKQTAPLNRWRPGPPLPQPVNIDAMAVNYMEDGTRKEPAPINAFHKSPGCVIGDNDTMVLPDVPATIFEGE